LVEKSQDERQGGDLSVDGRAMWNGTYIKKGF
jgi:hypothetical protein